MTSSSYRGQSPLAASNRDDLSEAESEDDTPLRTHAAHAADLVQQMVDNTCSGLTPDVTSSLDALQRIVQTKSKRKLQTVTTSPAKGAETPTIEGLKLPPLETAMMCLGMVRGKRRLNADLMIVAYHVHQRTKRSNICAFLSLSQSATSSNICLLAIHKNRQSQT